MELLQVSLDDKYSKDEGKIYLSGTQALVRLTLIQKRRDELAGLNTAGYVTGYRGSPLGGIDKAFSSAKKFLDKYNIKFHPAVNEDLAATALWGSQQVNLFSDSNYDGVFGIWYGKGPGVDRSGDVFRHANLAGSSKTGGVLVLAGDDPGCKSSTVPSQSEYALIDSAIPILYPTTVQEILDYGILGLAMSRHSGLWVGLKCITDNIDTSGSIDADPCRVHVLFPKIPDVPIDGLHIRWPDDAMEQETRLHTYKLLAAKEFAFLNKINKPIFSGSKARLGLMASGKQYLDTMQALSDLGIDKSIAKKLGLNLYKVGMPWPIEPKGVKDFGLGTEELLIIEEKRPVIEGQVKELLYNWPEKSRPRIVGKSDEKGAQLVPATNELSPELIARVIASRAEKFDTSGYIKNRLSLIRRKEEAQNKIVSGIKRTPYFCSGCPHNTSTKVPEGSRAAAGIGCHYMAIWMDRETSTYTHMGAEGANWIGQAPFTSTKHIFVNIGDGTYFHSGILAIRAAVASNVNVTYKILYNDAVAMTGGQSMDGPLDIPIIVNQVKAEGVEQVTIVTDEPEKYSENLEVLRHATVTHRDKLDEVQRYLREIQGVSVLVYDQTCAAEKRRRRKRGEFPNPAKRIFINKEVCEGCGDCGIASNCVAVAPIETELGRKRVIDQSACNKDYSCVNGFCPSFVSVLDAEPKKPNVVKNQLFGALPEPKLSKCAETFNIVIAGVGGTGIVTMGALLGMAAHIEGKGVSVLDVAGLAQKNGTVTSHIRISEDHGKLQSTRVPAGEANLILGCDMVTVSESDILSRCRANHTRAIINDNRCMTSDFVSNPDALFPEDDIYKRIKGAVGSRRFEFVKATRVAVELLGDSIAANIFLLGYCCQKNLLPLSYRSIERAIDINGVSVGLNKEAFLWGRRTAYDPGQVSHLLSYNAEKPKKFNLEVFIEDRASDLALYQSSDYAARYKNLINAVQFAENRVCSASTKLSEAAARCLYKLMAYKDEYEVARLYTDGRFKKALAKNFEPGAKIKFHLAPPLIAKRDPVTGHHIKREFGMWILILFRIIAKFKWLRGSYFDPFNFSAERKAERSLITEYEQVLREIIGELAPNNLEVAVELASIPYQIRGFGHVKEANRREAQLCQLKLLDQFRKLNQPQFNAAE